MWLVSVAPLNNVWLRLNNAIYTFRSINKFPEKILSNTTENNKVNEQVPASTEGKKM